jgi:hypothetical protein
MQLPQQEPDLADRLEIQDWANKISPTPLTIGTAFIGKVHSVQQSNSPTLSSFSATVSAFGVTVNNSDTV